jgi:hypothetical protein
MHAIDTGITNTEGSVDKRAGQITFRRQQRTTQLGTIKRRQGPPITRNNIDMPKSHQRPLSLR